MFLFQVALKFVHKSSVKEFRQVSKIKQLSVKRTSFQPVWTDAISSSVVQYNRTPRSFSKLLISARTEKPSIMLERAPTNLQTLLF